MTEHLPEPGLITDAIVTRVLDGDTIEVETRRTWRLRFLDCWAPETHETQHPNEKAIGLKAKQLLVEFLPVGTPVRVRIAGDGDADLADSTTMGRLLAQVWDKESGELINAKMLESGMCFETKPELEEWLSRSATIN